MDKNSSLRFPCNERMDNSSMERARRHALTWHPFRYVAKGQMGNKGDMTSMVGGCCFTEFTEF